VQLVDQCRGESIDPVHFEWLHDNWSRALRARTDRRAPAHQRLGFEGGRVRYGCVYRRFGGHDGQDECVEATAGVHVAEYCLYVG